MLIVCKDVFFHLNYFTGCLICGSDLVYEKQPRERACSICGEKQSTIVACTAGHFVCDRCHSLGALDLIEQFCRTTALEDPLAIACVLMRNPAIKMHGPEHHSLVPAVLLTTYYNHRQASEKKVRALPQARMGRTVRRWEPASS
jgi:hypothetical protein